MSNWLRKAVALSTVRSIILLSLVFGTPALHAQGNAGSSTAMTSGESSSRSSQSESAIPSAVAKELEAMKQRIAQLEVELQKSKGQDPPSASLAKAAVPANSALPAATPEAQASQESTPPKTEKAEPFAYADWTWLNGTARNKDTVWDSKFFTPEIRFDTHFVHSFNHPRDDTMGGSSEIFRSNEVQVEQISFGGDFHWQNVRGRVLTMNGMFGVTTPRNDASPGRGQWDLRGAYRYVSEAYGGYHFDVNHGLNLDAGIFVSYIGLFSYYNFDNWTYQPSFVSSNTPWFFNGLRIQWFPTDKLKIEPWIINGWQSYGRLGSKPGLGGQILWRPKPWLSLVFNNYGMGEDTLGQRQRPVRPLAHPHRRQRRGQVLRSAAEVPRQDGVLVHRRSGLRIRRPGVHHRCRWKLDSSQHELPPQHRNQPQADVRRLDGIQPVLVQEGLLRPHGRRRHYEAIPGAIWRCFHRSTAPMPLQVRPTSRRIPAILSRRGICP